MKNIIILLFTILSLTSCSRYIPLTKEKYQILNRDGNSDKITARFLKEIPIEMVDNDTIFTEVDSKGTAQFNYEKRKVKPIPAGTKVKIVEPKEDSFVAEFVNYNLKVEMILNKNDEWVIKKKNGVIEGTSYKTSVSNPEILFKYKRKDKNKQISLKK